MFLCHAVNIDALPLGFKLLRISSLGLPFLFFVKLDINTIPLSLESVFKKLLQVIRVELRYDSDFLPRHQMTDHHFRLHLLQLTADIQYKKSHNDAISELNFPFPGFENRYKF